MPSFANSKHLPLTPPDYGTGWTVPFSGLPYQQPAYGSQPAYRVDELYDNGNRYVTGQVHAQAHAPALIMAPTMSVPAAGAPVNRPCDDMVLPPVQPLEPVAVDPYQAPPVYQRYDPRPQQQKEKEEKPVGGVSAKLDYDMESMTDFVAEAACSLVPTGRPMPAGFRSWLSSVLCATRLPAATLVLSLHYLSGRMQQLRAEGYLDFSDNHVYRALTVALIMGSKFLDDNTFVNRSWADVSSIDIQSINCMERDWLASINWCLHVDPAEPNGFNDWMQHWRLFEQRAVTHSAQSLKLSPLDTNVQRQSVSHKAFTPESAMMSTFTPMTTAFDFNTRSHYSNQATPSYNAIDQWYSSQPRRLSSDSPASSTPLTGGPPTPEHYGAPGIWAPINPGYFRALRPTPCHGVSATGQCSRQLPAPLQRTPCMPYTLSYEQRNAWSGHNIQCACVTCVSYLRLQSPYWTGPHHASSMVAA